MAGFTTPTVSLVVVYMLRDRHFGGENRVTAATWPRRMAVIGKRGRLRRQATLKLSKALRKAPRIDGVWRITEIVSSLASLSWR